MQGAGGFFKVSSWTVFSSEGSLSTQAQKDRTQRLKYRATILIANLPRIGHQAMPLCRTQIQRRGYINLVYFHSFSSLK
jgi:hypothetical protein